MKRTDKDLLNDISKKDELAFKELYDRYSKPVFKQVSSRITDINIIEDLLQEYWLFIWSSSSLIRLDEKGDASKSLFFILSKRILDHYRNAGKNIVYNKDNFENTISSELQYTHVFEDLIEKEIFELIDQLIANLPELDKLIFDFRIRKQLSIKETAAELSISEKTVQNRMTKISSEIRSQLTLVSIFITSSYFSEFINNLDKHLPNQLL
ncbi:MAG: RNA polymerase sigma factor [Dysgonomonas sp.]